MEPSFEQQLSSCDKEPIHVIGSVQNHGILLVFNPADRRITNASENVIDLLGESARQLIGRRIDDILSPGDLAPVLGAIKNLSVEESQLLRVTLLKGGGTMEAFLFSCGDLVGLEIERRKAGNEASLVRLNTIQREFIQNLRRCTTVATASKLICQTIRTLTDFDRVMVYKFLPNWDGTVLAEDRGAETHSFLEHRFPAGDIPLPARELYRLNRTRLIADIESAPVPVYPMRHPTTREPVDLTHSKLRSISPVHLEYLRNMGVRSSFSAAILVDDRLWGLIACHGNQPADLSQDVRAMCDALASTFGMAAGMMERLNEQSERLEFENGLRGLFQDLKGRSGPLDQLLRSHQRVLEIFHAQGLAFVGPSGVDIAGLTPVTTHVNEIAEKVRALMAEDHQDVWATDALPSAVQLPENVSACGLLAIALPEIRDSMFLLFREEFERTIVWGGDPRKSVDRRDYRGPINPRNSFASWSQTIKHRSRPWEAREIQGARYLRDFIFDALVKKEMLLEELGRRKL